MLHREPGTKTKRRRVCTRCGGWLTYSRPAVNESGLRVMSGQWGHTHYMGDLLASKNMCDEVIIDPEART